MVTLSKNRTFLSTQRFYFLVFFLYSIPLVLFSYFIITQFSNVYTQNFNNSLLSFAQDIDEGIDVNAILEESIREEFDTDDRKIFPFSLKNAYVVIRNNELRPLAFNGSEKTPNLIKEITSKEFEELVNKGNGSSFIEKIENEKGDFFQINYFSTNIKNEQYLIQILVPATYLEKEKSKIFNKILVMAPVILITILFITFYLLKLYLSPIKKMNENLLNASDDNHLIKIDSRLPSVINTFLKNINNLLLKERELRKSQELFIAYASHQLKTPLTIIRGNAQSQLKKESNENVSEIMNTVIEMEDLINKLTVLASINESSKIETSEIDLISLILEITDENEKLINQNKLNVKFQYDEDTTYAIISDPHLLKVLLSNLINNALKYSTGARDIIVSLMNNGESTKVMIFNSFDYISNSEIENLSKPFYRLPKTSKDVEGNGLGLSIVDKICEILDIEFKIEYISGNIVTTLYIKNI